MRRYVSAVACMLAAVIVAAAPAAADGGHGGGGDGDQTNNIVYVNNADSTRSAVRTGTAVAANERDSINNINVAYARSYNCTGCRSVAVAVQVVIVEGTPTTIQPQNGAFAVNENCNSCQTFAYAHQYLISPNHKVEIGEQTWGQVQSIRSQIDAVAHSTVDFPTMSSELDQLSQQFYDTLAQAVQNQNDGESASHHDQRQVQEHD